MPDRDSAEQALQSIAGVISARVFIDGEEFSEVHVLADGERHPKQVVRDVETCLNARFGVTVDHRRISVAQIDPVTDDERRLSCDYVQVTHRGPTVAVEVGLTNGARSAVGSSSGPATPRGRLYLIVDATIRAVQQMCGSRIHLFVEDVARREVAGRATIVAIVTLTDGRTDDTYVGSAYVRRDEAEAAARAALDAVNRRLALLMQDGAATL